MRKRRTKYIWLPCLGADSENDEESSFSNSFPFSLSDSTSVRKVGAGGLALFPILEDTPREQVTQQNPESTIADYIGTDYVIKRIVGKIHIGCAQNNVDVWPGVTVTAGFFVARASENPLVPVGANNVPEAVENYDPNYVDNIREPWIWRRTWVLGNSKATPTDPQLATFVDTFPVSTSFYGSQQDGPHIDAKTGRRIRNDERLYFSASARGENFGSSAATVTGNNNLHGVLDVRVLGALRRAQNRSNF